MTARVRRPVLALVCLLAPLTLAAQHLTPAGPGERCGGERIVAIRFTGMQRDITDRFGALGAWVNRSARTLQPQTRTRIVSRFLLLHVGDACDEERRVESEGILHSQPYLSDAVIRVQRVAPGEVELRVESIDEYMLFLAAWGITGVPVGFETGTGNLFGGAHALAGTLEYGRGGDIGGGVKYTDYQAFGAPLVLRMNVASRPQSHYGGFTLDKPSLSNFQETSWHISAGYSRLYTAFHDTTLGAVFIDYLRRGWILSGNKRVQKRPGGLSIGLIAAGEYADPVQTVTLGPSGYVPVSAPALGAHYQAFQSERVGFAAGYSSVHYLTVRGLDYLSAPEDLGLGWAVDMTALKSLNLLDNERNDAVGSFGVHAAAGTEVSAVQISAGVETRVSSGDNSLPGVVGSGRIGWFGKTSIGHVTSIGIEFAGGVRSRLPLQLTFRDDDGLIGFRSQDLGGTQRTIVRLEDRYAIPSPSAKLELAIAGLVQAGRLVAGDAPYGVTTPWCYGVGISLIGAIPAGAKHTVRLEFGVPLNPTGQRSLQFRMGYGDSTPFFGGEPGAVSGARELSR